MIENVEIRNFKSIRRLKLDCRRVNIFIGKPNTGKSNILEALGTYSYSCYSPYAELREFVRFQRTTNLFYDELVNENVVIALNSHSLGIEFGEGRFLGKLSKNDQILIELSGNYNKFRVSSVIGKAQELLLPIKFYRFATMETFDRLESEFLLPPHGRNLLSLIMTNRELRDLAKQLFSEFALRLVLEPQDNKIKVQKQSEDIIVSYPYSLTSDTLLRVVFHLSAIVSNKESILVFEEPEAHAFPYYTKYLAEKIALDARHNQYFISTHNPYFLLPIIEQVNADDLRIFVTYFDKYQTKVKILEDNDLELLLGMDVDLFFDLERFISKK